MRPTWSDGPPSPSQRPTTVAFVQARGDRSSSAVGQGSSHAGLPLRKPALLAPLLFLLFHPSHPSQKGRSLQAPPVRPLGRTHRFLAVSRRDAPRPGLFGGWRGVLAGGGGDFGGEFGACPARRWGRGKMGWEGWDGGTSYLPLYLSFCAFFLSFFLPSFLVSGGKRTVKKTPTCSIGAPHPRLSLTLLPKKPSQVSEGDEEGVGLERKWLIQLTS